MRITDIKAYPVWIAARNLLIVKVETDAGIFGLGESGLSSREQAVFFHTELSLYQYCHKMLLVAIANLLIYRFSLYGR